jgi:hypothetical protein
MVHPGKHTLEWCRVVRRDLTGLLLQYEQHLVAPLVSVAMPQFADVAFV